MTEALLRGWSRLIVCHCGRSPAARTIVMSRTARCCSPDIKRRTYICRTTKKDMQNSCCVTPAADMHECRATSFHSIGTFDYSSRAAVTRCPTCMKRVIPTACIAPCWACCDMPAAGLSSIEALDTNPCNARNMSFWCYCLCDKMAGTYTFEPCMPAAVV